MELITKKDGSNVTIEIIGWLDTQTAPQLGEELAKLDDSVTSLVFDFDKLEYISSAGLRQVISAYKKMSGKDGFKIINVSDEVFDVFSLTGSISLIWMIPCRIKDSSNWYLQNVGKRSSGIACRMTVREVLAQGSS